jgi:N-hydroxyarylamine O-acetyltransferase
MPVVSTSEYLDRIGFAGPVRPDEATLRALHRAHLEAIPYENLEIQLGRENALAEPAFFDKLVARRRGGWCYEMNGLLTTVLREIGFRVTRVAGGVGRQVRGDEMVGNHLVGLVDLDRRYVVDVGLGDGPLEPFPLEEGEWCEGALRFRLERLDDGFWRLHNHQHGQAQSFDFSEAPRELDSFADTCTLLQTADFSTFVNFAIVMRRTATGGRTLRDATYIEVDGRADERTEREITSRAEYAALVSDLLGHDLGAETDTLWRRVESRVRDRGARA